MELEGDRHEARRITIGVKSRGQLLPSACQWSTPEGYAEGAPYDFKDSLKRRGYRWNDGSDERPRSWYKKIDRTALDEELSLLRREIYQCDVELVVQPLTATTRFSSRM